MYPVELRGERQPAPRLPRRAGAERAGERVDHLRAVLEIPPRRAEAEVGELHARVAARLAGRFDPRRGRVREAEGYFLDGLPTQPELAVDPEAIGLQVQEGLHRA